MQSPHFWTLASSNFTGGIKIEVTFNCDPRHVTNTVKSMFSQVNQILIEIKMCAVINLLLIFEIKGWCQRIVCSNRLSFGTIGLVEDDRNTKPHKNKTRKYKLISKRLFSINKNRTPHLYFSSYHISTIYYLFRFLFV